MLVEVALNFRTRRPELCRHLSSIWSGNDSRLIKKTTHPKIMNIVHESRKYGMKKAIVTAAIAAATLIQPALHAGTCSVNGGTTFQTIDGIGFSTAWCGTLSSAKNAALYDTLGFSILRVRIDQNRSWAEETANSSAAHSRGLKVLGSCWSGPPQWNSNGQTGGGSLLASHYGDYAAFLRDAANTINIDWVSFQNEPDINDFVVWTPSQMLTFLKNNSATIARPICYAESFHYDDAFTDPALNDGSAVGKISVVGGHIYGGGLNTHQNALNKGKHVWQTEHFVANSRDSINNSLIQAKEIQDCMNNQMSAYFYWWVNDTDASVNLVNQSGTIFKAGYVAGQFAKWVRPGKLRIAATYNPTSGIYVTAYRSGGLVIVAVNNSGSSVNQTFALQNITGVTSLLANRTSSSQNMAAITAATVSSNAFTYTLPAQSVTTFHQF